jgi:uncharacterized protein DUF6907
MSATTSPESGEEGYGCAPASSGSFSMPLFGGGSMTVPCPSWCVLEHAADGKFRGSPEDVTHMGADVALSLPVYGGEEQVLVAYIVQTPYGRVADPAVTLWPTGEDLGEAAERLGVAELDSVIERVAAHLGRLQVLRAQLARLLA